MRPKVTILIGISGSGKSTMIKSELGDTIICSADKHFTDEKGNYNFNPTQLGDAHAACFYDAVEAVRNGLGVVIDNTNTSIAEISPYIALANAYQAELRIVVIRCDAGVAAGRNKHGVPEKAIRGMASRLDGTLKYWPPFWPEPEVRDAAL